MKTFLRILAWTFGGLAVLAVGGLIAGWFVEFRQSDAELTAEFSQQLIRPVVHHYTVQDGQSRPRTIRFVETPAHQGQPTILFIHGAPSSLSFFNGFLHDASLLNQAQLVAVDRPGYGYSDFGRVETSIARQAQLLQPLIDRYKPKAGSPTPYLILVGSSYGGSVAARLAMNNPDVVKHVVFVSSALGPGLERTYGISHWVDKPPLRWVVPTLLQLANDEKLAHRQALNEILPDWPKIKAAITMLHGQLDELVYPANVLFAKQQLVNARVKEFILPENRHDIVLNKREYIARILLDILNGQAGKPALPLVHKRPPVTVAKTNRHPVLEDFISAVIKL